MAYISGPKNHEEAQIRLNVFMIEIIEILQQRDYYGAGKFTEIAKGKYEMVRSWKDIKEKIKRKRKA